MRPSSPQSGSSADISSGHGGEGRLRRIDIKVTPYTAPQSDKFCIKTGATLLEILI